MAAYLPIVPLQILRAFGVSILLFNRKEPNLEEGIVFKVFLNIRIMGKLIHLTFLSPAVRDGMCPSDSVLKS
jgi:hypothetical protein